MPKLADVADGVVTVLVANGFTEAARRYLPYTQLQDLASRKTSVVPKLDTLEDGARGGGDRTFEVTIVIQQQVDPADNSAMDTLVGHVETLIEACDVGGFLRAATPAGTEFVDGPTFPRGVAFDPEKLHEQRMFFSALVIQFQLTE